MTFSEQLRDLEATPEELVVLIECSQRTAYSWLSGERSPKPFIQRLIIESLQRIRASGEGLDAKKKDILSSVYGEVKE